MAVYGYIKVPARRPDREHGSAERQIRAIVRYAMRRGWGIRQVFPEWEPSCDKRFEIRPQGKNLLSVLEEGDVVIASRLDHMFGSAEEVLPALEGFRRRKASLIILDPAWEITQGDLADRVFTILGAVARIESDRTRPLAPAARAAGYLGGAARAFGYAAAGPDDGQPVPVGREQAILHEIAVLRESGFSCDKISHLLKRKGFFFSPEAVRRLVRSGRPAHAAAT